MSRENEKQKSGNAFINALKKSNMTAMAAILVVMIIIASIVSPYFLNVYNLQSVLRDLAFVGMIGIGEDWPMNSIAASVIGGVALTGGVGNPAGALIGAAVITIIQNIIVLFGVNSYWQSAVSGIVVVLAISFSSISTIVRENRQKRIKLN